MQQQQERQGRKSGLLYTKQSRRDHLSAQLVEIGIVIQHVQGTECAAEYLMSKKVDFEVAVRVLSHPSRRRTWSELANPAPSPQRGSSDFQPFRRM